jgi:hypothetical protein
MGIKVEQPHWEPRSAAGASGLPMQLVHWFAHSNEGQHCGRVSTLQPVQLPCN